MNPFKKIFASLCCLLLLSTNAQNENPLSFIEDGLDNYVQQALEKWEIPGVAICVVKDGKVVVSKGYGVNKLGSKQKVNDQTIFMIGSNTKAFTGTALALLEHQGKCNLNDQVKKWYPNFKMKDPWVEEHATLTDIITHRLGMETFQGDFMWWESDMPLSMMIQKFGDLSPDYSFRTKWGYCNMGYAIAGQCIEEISGQPWHSYLNNNIFIPLEMNRTYCYVSDLENLSNLAVAHTLIYDEVKVIPYGKIDALAPAGTIQSSANDMGKWAMMLLNEGKVGDKEILPAEVIARTRKPESIQGRAGHPFNKTHYSLYALGWGLQDYEGTEIVSHTGGVNGFVTSVTLLPEHNMGIIVLTNTDHNYFYEAVKWEILDSYLGLPYRDYSNIYFNYWKNYMDSENKSLSARRDTVKSKPETNLNLEAYTGIYVHEVYGNTTITKKGRNLEITFQHHPQLKGKLEPLGGSRFLCTYSSTLYGIKVFPFVIEGEQVKSFTLSVADFLEFTTYEFIKQ